MSRHRQPARYRDRARAIVVARARERQALVQRQVLFGLALCGLVEYLLLLLRIANG